MKFEITTTTLIVAAGLASAAPSPQYGGKNWGGWKDDKEKSYGASPFEFSSTYGVVAVPGEVINGTTVTPGEPGAVGYFNYGINSQLNTICYNITLVGVTGDYQSPAETATHIHQANKGASGPPRIAFPNPVGDDKIRRSVGCLTGPFTTGIMANGQDTGTGFTVAQIEANPANFFTDTHTAKYVPGAVRGQLA